MDFLKIFCKIKEDFYKAIFLKQLLLESIINALK